MRTEGKVSKVAYCENCNGFVLASHIDFLDKKIEKEFTELRNEGFVVKTETISETKAREYATYQDCVDKKCKK